MKKAVKKIVCVLSILCVLFTVAVVPAFADSEPVFDHSSQDVMQEVCNADREYEVSGSVNNEWFAYGTSSVFQYNEYAQNFFDKFRGSAGKYILPVEYYKTVDGKNSLIDGYTPVSCPDYFELSYCAVMVVRMNARGMIYCFWTYAENFKVQSKYDTLYGDGLEVPIIEEQELQIEYDVVPIDFTSWWQDTTEAGLPSYNDLPWEYWDRDVHVDYSSSRCYQDGDEFAYWHELVYDTMRLNDTNASNYTLCYVVVSMEQLMIDYESKMSYNQGYNDGRTIGYDKGYDLGYTDGESAHADDWQYGFDIGYLKGTNDGIDSGYEMSRDYYDDYWSNFYQSINYGNAVEKSIKSNDSNPVTAFFNSMWNGLINAYDTVTQNVSVGGVSFAMVITTIILAVVVIWLIRVLRP